MPKYYEPDNFEDSYREFLKKRIGILSNSQKKNKSAYIDPDKDCVPDFYNDLAYFLNEREEELKKEIIKEYYFFQLQEDQGKIIVKQGNEGLFRLTSDQFGFRAGDNIYENPEDKRYPLPNLLYSYQNNSEAEQKKIIDRITEYVKNTRTIGGSFLWPVPLEGNGICSYNSSRGVGSYLEDRVDLTLEDIKRSYYGKDSFKKNEDMKKWLEHFGSFKNFVEYFMLEPFCEKVPVNSGEEEYDYVPVNIIDGKLIDEDKIEKYCKSGMENYAVRNLGKKDIINMLDRLEGMILVRTANMERVIESYKEKQKIL